MPITDIDVTWGTSTIIVPKSAMTLIQSSPTTIYSLNLDQFRLQLKNLEDDAIGMAYQKTHNHNTTVTVGGVTLARVVEILAPYTVTFEDGQYAVNLEAANSNVGDRTNVNQVSIRSANSAGLVDLDVLLAASYQGQVCVDIQNISGFAQAGTATPVGTRAIPCNNFADAITIAENNSIKRFQLMSSATLTINDFSDGYMFYGDNANTNIVTLNAGANVTNCEFKNLTVTGTLDGNNTLKECQVGNLTYTYGFLFQCAISEGIAIAAGSRCAIFECYANPTSIDTDPIIDMGGTGSLTAQHLSGNFKIINSDGTGDIYLGMDGGVITIDGTVTGGDIYVHKTADIIDNSTGTAVVYDFTDRKAIETVPASVWSYTQ